MISRYLLAVLFAFGVTMGAYAAVAVPEELNVNVTIKGALHEDKNGFFVVADGNTYDLHFNESGRADMHKFYGDLRGDWVQISGALAIGDVVSGKPTLTVFANDVSRFKHDGVVTERREVVTEPAPIIVREHYVEPRHGINLPGVHINW